MFRSNLTLIAAAALALAASACGTTSEAAPVPASSQKAQPASTASEAQALCTEMFTRNRTCTDSYIPALVDLRAKYDMPAGIADEVRTNRADVIARAKGEWANDSTDTAIAATCARITAQVTEDMRADAEQGRACLAQQDCAAYTTCVMPFFEKRFTK